MAVSRADGWWDETGGVDGWGVGMGGLAEWMDGWDERTVELRGSEFSKGRMLFGRETNDSRWLVSRGSVNRDGGGYGVGHCCGMGMGWMGCVGKGWRDQVVAETRS